VAYVYRPRVAIIGDVFELTRLRPTPALRISRLSRLRGQDFSQQDKNKDPDSGSKLNLSCYNRPEIKIFTAVNVIAYLILCTLSAVNTI